MISEYKLGEEIKDKEKELGVMSGAFGQHVKLVKIVYTLQDENATTLDIGLEHTSFIKDEDDEDE